MATGTTQLTTVLGSFTDPVMLEEAADDDQSSTAGSQDVVLPVDEIMTSSASISELTHAALQPVPPVADPPSVSSAPAAISTEPTSVLNPAASAASVRQTGVSEMNE